MAYCGVHGNLLLYNMQLIFKNEKGCMNSFSFLWLWIGSGFGLSLEVLRQNNSEGEKQQYLCVSV